MFRLFNLFGRSAALNTLDMALRESGVHPVLVPEAVKLTVLRLHKQEAASGARAAEAAYGKAAELFAYCMLGREHFIESNSVFAADRAEGRVEAAIASGDSLDAQIILLALHAGLLAPEIADRFDVEDR